HHSAADLAYNQPCCSVNHVPRCNGDCRSASNAGYSLLCRDCICSIRRLHDADWLSNQPHGIRPRWLYVQRFRTSRRDSHRAIHLDFCYIYHLFLQTHLTVNHLYPITTKVSRDQREELLSQRARLIWFTGLSGSGKSTLAVQLEAQL